ncbi:hypothetical protein [Streptococcus ruminicola]|uniref:hypothetical protein n=1 Tax=Streptococcus ruminicola TaxID=2686210 RepID=UPI0012FCE91D|nr:hypothetical protein [Streptococcus ruminicola]QGX01511.1 hypothetical protein GO995_09295 [Streptococcus ruminicola]
MKLFKNKAHGDHETKEYNDFQNLIGSGYVRQANFDDMYLQYTPEQLEELIASLKETIQFLEYQKDLSSAFAEEQMQEVQHLLKNKKEGNLSYLRKDEGWLLRILKR